MTVSPLLIKVKPMTGAKAGVSAGRFSEMYNIYSYLKMCSIAPVEGGGHKERGRKGWWWRGGGL